MKQILVLLSVVTLGSSLNLQAQTPDPTLPELSWLSGYWTSTEDGTTIEELWTTGSGYMMLGLHRNVYSNGRSSFENLRIMQTRDGILYVASPGGKPGTIFKMTKNSNQKVVFENFENDFPQRITYSRTGNKLTARIENEAGDKSMEWIWTKTKPEF